MIQFNVLIHDFNKKTFEPYDIMPHLKDCYDKVKKKPKSFKEIKEFIINESRYQWWSRCEYEIIVTGWPDTDVKNKIDIHDQIMMNIDLITNLFMCEINGIKW